MKRIVFSIYIDIPDEQLDNPAGYDWKTGQQETTNKSHFVKQQLAIYRDRLIRAQQDYALLIGADYDLITHGDFSYDNFCSMFATHYRMISKYDVINFYKHWLMKEYAKEYDQICYLDFDVVPYTQQNIFEAFDPNNHFVVAEQNSDALWGKKCRPQDYTTCIRNPATKYWNTHAMLSEIGIFKEPDVFNTGIMLAGKEIINQLDYFGDFRGTIDLMSYLKYDPDSMYPQQIQRVFNYDNETVFSYKIIKNDVPVQYMGNLWHHRVSENRQVIDPEAKMVHVINKLFGPVFHANL